MWSYSSQRGSARGVASMPAAASARVCRVALAAQRAVHRDRPPQPRRGQPAPGELGLAAPEVGEAVVVVGPERGLAVADEEHDRHARSLLDASCLISQLNAPSVDAC